MRPAGTEREGVTRQACATHRKPAKWWASAGRAESTSGEQFRGCACKQRPGERSEGEAGASSANGVEWACSGVGKTNRGRVLHAVRRSCREVGHGSRVRNQASAPPPNYDNAFEVLSSQPSTPHGGNVRRP